MNTSIPNEPSSDSKASFETADVLPESNPIVTEDQENLEIEQTRGHLSSAICNTLYSFIGSLSSKKKPPKKTATEDEETTEVKGDLTSKMLDLDTKPVTVELVEGTIVETENQEERNLTDIKLSLDLEVEKEIKTEDKHEEICSPQCSENEDDIMEAETIDQRRTLNEKSNEKKLKEKENELVVSTKENIEGNEEEEMESTRSMKVKGTDTQDEEKSPLNFEKPLLPELSEEKIVIEHNDNNAIEVENVTVKEQMVEEVVAVEQQRLDEEISNHGLDKLQINSDKSEEGLKQEDFEHRIESQEAEFSGSHEELSRNAFSHQEPIVNVKSSEGLASCEEENLLQPVTTRSDSTEEKAITIVDLSNTGLSDSFRLSLNAQQHKGKQQNVPHKYAVSVQKPAPKKVIKTPALKGVQSVQSKTATSRIEPNIFRVNSMAQRSNNSYARQHSESLTRKNAQNNQGAQSVQNKQISKPFIQKRDVSTKITVQTTKVEIANRRSSTVSSHRNSYSSMGSTNKRKQDAIAAAQECFKRMKTETLAASTRNLNKGKMLGNQTAEKIKIDLTKSTIISFPQKAATQKENQPVNRQVIIKKLGCVYCGVEIVSKPETKMLSCLHKAHTKCYTSHEQRKNAHCPACNSNNLAYSTYDKRPVSQTKNKEKAFRV